MARQSHPVIRLIVAGLFMAGAVWSFQRFDTDQLEALGGAWTYSASTVGVGVLLALISVILFVPQLLDLAIGAFTRALYRGGMGPADRTARAGHLHSANEEWEKAVTDFRKSLEIRNDPGVRLHMAEIIAHHLHRYGEAMAELDVIRSMDPIKPIRIRTKLLKAEIMIHDSGDLEEARRLISAAMAYLPDKDPIRIRARGLLTQIEHAAEPKVA